MSRLTYKVNDTYYVNEPRHLYDDTWELVQVLGKLEDLMEKYEIEDLTDLEIALDYYYHRFDGLHTERVINNE